MSYFWALLAGGLLGLAGLPPRGAEIPGLLWPLPFFLMAKHRSFSFRSATFGCLTFIVCRYLVQNIWIYQAVKYYCPQSFLKTPLIYLSAVLILSIPFVLFSGAWFCFCRAFHKHSPLLDKHWRSIFILSFPLINYLSFKFNEFSVFSGLPGGRLAEKSFFLNNFSRVYSYLGVDGFEFFILLSLIVLNLCLFSVCRSKMLFLLLPWVVIIFCQVDKTPAAGDSRPKLNLLLVPWSDHLKDNASREVVLENLLSRSKAANRPSVDLIIWGETALPGLAEQGRDMERIQKELLLPSQALIFGGNRREFGHGRFKDFNAAYILSGEQFQYDIYKKERPVPFTEYIPPWARKLGMETISPQKHIFTPGEPKIFHFKNHTIGVGVCYDQYFDKWYLKRDSEVDLYVFINRERPFQALGKKILYLSALGRALQTEKPVARLTNGGFSGIMGEHLKKKSSGKWDRRSQTVIYQTTPGGRTSFYYKWGYYWTPLILFSYTCLTLGAYFKIIKTDKTPYKFLWIR